MNELKIKTQIITLQKNSLTTFEQAKCALANFSKLNYISDDLNAKPILENGVADHATGAMIHQQTVKGNYSNIIFLDEVAR